MRLLAFDYGTKKIGVAIGQMVTKTANPLSQITVSKGLIDWRQIDKLIDEWKPGAIVVGIPCNMDGSEMATTGLARAFSQEMQKCYPNLPIYMVDERLTTKAAKAILFEKRGYRGLAAQEIDSIAACLILEQWMDNNDEFDPK